jgi:hypothetical protein
VLFFLPLQLFLGALSQRLIPTTKLDPQLHTKKLARDGLTLLWLGARL